MRIGLIQAFAAMLPSDRFAASSPQRGEPELLNESHGMPAARLVHNEAGHAIQASPSTATSRPRRADSSMAKAIA